MKKIDDEGKQTISFLDAPTIDCKFLPSRKALEFRLTQLVQIIICGDADYARMIEDRDDIVAKLKIEKHGLLHFKGEEVKREILTSRLTFLRTWESRRYALIQECEGLKRSIALTSD